MCAWPGTATRPRTTRRSAAVLSLLNDNSAWPVFVHCRRGADRTGTAIACYRIAHDHWTNQQALGEAKTFGMSSLEVAMQHFILRFNSATPQLAAAARTRCCARCPSRSDPLCARCRNSAARRSNMILMPLRKIAIARAARAVWVSVSRWRSNP